MLFRNVPKTGDSLSILGFGYMRLPVSRFGTIDEEAAVSQLRYAIDHGVTYVDTAPAYHLGRSEKILGRALEGGYREKVRIATKLPPWSVASREDMDRILSGQLAALKTGSIDYYLLHSLSGSSWEKMRSLDVTGFLDEAKQDGRIKNAGFSFHGNVSDFKTIVDGYPWEFCQIQYNYLDENIQAGTEGLKYAASRGLAVMVMEPLRGGNLAGRVPEEVSRIFQSAPVRHSPAEWALLWVWNHPEVTVVLSGMNEYSHIDENIRIAGTAYPDTLTEEDLAVISRARDTWKNLQEVGCTGCGYCMPCPSGVDIPGCFAHYNEYLLFSRNRTALFHYIGRHGGVLSGPSHAGLCSGCGACERKCPQHLPIRDHLSSVDRDMGRMIGVMVPIIRAGLWFTNRAERYLAWWPGRVGKK
jgi:predicted aldo/keto reductase-like oxidoreductase